MSINLRILAKSLVWRIISTIITLSLVYIITGDLSVATTIAVINFVLKTILYYFYEHIWEHIIACKFDK